MKFDDLRINMRVYDTWYPSRRGRVTEIGKTYCKVEMIVLEAGEVQQVKWDKAHVQKFLQPLIAGKPPAPSRHRP